MKKIALLIIGILFFVSSVNVCWAKFPPDLPDINIAPDSPFYFLKIWWEKIVTFFNFNAENKANRYRELAEKRLQEAGEMLKKGKDKLGTTLLEKYEQYIDKASEKAEQIKQQTKQEVKDVIKQKIEQTKNKAQQFIDSW